VNRSVVVNWDALLEIVVCHSSPAGNMGWYMSYNIPFATYTSNSGEGSIFMIMVITVGWITHLFPNTPLSRFYYFSLLLATSLWSKMNINPKHFWCIVFGASYLMIWHNWYKYSCIKLIVVPVTRFLVSLRRITMRLTEQKAEFGHPTMAVSGRGGNNPQDLSFLRARLPKGVRLRAQNVTNPSI
jgi:hypothetical protein